MSNRKRGLGRGLSALLGDNIEQTANREVLEIDLNDIYPNENQPRLNFNKDKIEELSSSIKENGLIQPIVVRKGKKEKYEIIAGERRYRASKLAKLKTIQAIVMDIDKETSARLALIENIQREDLNPIEEALGYKSIIDEFKITQEELSTSIGKSRSYISNSMRLLNLDKEVIDLIERGEISTGHGKALLGLKTKREQKNLAEKIIANSLSVRETENLVKDKKDTKKKNTTKEKVKKSDEGINNEEFYFENIREELMSTLGTKVEIKEYSNLGKIEIDYYGDDDLKRIIDIIVKN